MRDRMVNLSLREFCSRIGSVLLVGFLAFETLFCFFCWVDGMDPKTEVICQYQWPHDPVDAALGWARPVACPIGRWMNQGGLSWHR